MIARKSALIIMVQLLNGVIGYIGLKFIALYMQPWEYGVIGFAYGFVALFSIIGNLGVDDAHLKKVSEGKDLGRCIGTFIVSKTFLAGVFAGVTLLSIAVWNNVLGRGFETPLHEQVVYIILPYFVLLTLTKIFLQTFNARKETAKAQLPLLVYNLVRIGLTIFVVVNGLGVVALAYTYISGEIVHFLLTLYLVRKYPIKKPTKEYVYDYAKFAFPLMFAAVAYTIMTNIDKVFIQLFWNAQAVGEYFAVNNLSRYIIVFSFSVGVLLFPTISEYHAQKNTDKIKDLTVRSERYMSMVVFPIVITLVVLAEPVIRILLSNRYLPAVMVLQIIPFFALIEVYSRPYVAKLKGMNMPVVARNRVIIMAVVNVGLNLVLIPQDIKSLGIRLAGLGGVGAAIATVTAYFVGLVYVRIESWRRTGISGSFRVLLHAFAAVVMGIILHLISTVFPVDRWFQLVGISLLGLAIYLAILYVLREFKKEDLALFLDTLNIRKMLSYIKEEIFQKNQ